ncbi:MAG: aldehyde dehydrogenase family protein [Mycetocola sp.]
MTSTYTPLSTRFPEVDAAQVFAMIIDGQNVPSSDGRTFRCVDPFEDAEWGHIPSATEADVDAAVAAARRAFPGWAATSPWARAELFRTWSALIREYAAELARLQVHENGKTITEMTYASQGMATHLDYAAQIALTLHGSTVAPMMPGHSAWSVRVPIGVVAAIAPWNNPLGLLTAKVFPALAAGNTVVIKPSEVTPVSTIRLVQLAHEAGIPAGVINVVTGAGPVGAALAGHPGIDKVGFTGSTSTGRKVAAAASSHLAKVTLELGGKGAHIVFADANLTKAVEGLATGILSGTGQACNAGSRIFLHEEIRDEVLERLKERLAAVRIGDPLDPSNEIGPLASRAQFAKVTSYFDIAQSEEHTALIQGAGRGTDLPGISGGLFVEPTLYDTPDRLSRLRREEIFGPVASVITFSSEDEVIELANDSEFGLVAGLWTQDLDRARRVAGRLESGVVWINTWRAFSFNMPFGGRKDSGIGHELGIDEVSEYTEEKAIWLGPDQSS